MSDFRGRLFRKLSCGLNNRRIDFLSRMLAFRRAWGETGERYINCCSCVYKKILRSKLSRRMPCETNTQVPGTLVPQNKEGFDSVTLHEGNLIFIFEESSTLRSNKFVNEELVLSQNNRLRLKKKHWPKPMLYFIPNSVLILPKNPFSSSKDKRGTDSPKILLAILR
jgi:hypothetical protein